VRQCERVRRDVADFGLDVDEAVRIERLRIDDRGIERVRDDNKRATFLWCSPTLNYLPVRIDQREDDNSNFRMLLKEYTGGGQH
jgi:hypothetical protein